MRSSYAQNNYGDILKQYVIAWRPASFVELGVLDGYSTLAIAQGIKELERLEKTRGNDNPWAKLHAYDLFDDYKFNHGNQEEVQKMLADNNVADSVILAKGDAYKVCENYPDTIINSAGEPGRGVEFLHIDISNNGKVVHDIMELWHPKIGARGLIFIEGGSEERDNIDWMKKYGFPPIREEINTNPLINKYYDYATYFKFPSLTVLLRKHYGVE
jgi:hypothetical protein